MTCCGLKKLKCGTLSFILFKPKQERSLWDCKVPKFSKFHFFPPAFCAALVTLPCDGSAFSTSLMTPTATVCLMSRTAKRPKGAYAENGSTHMGLLGTIMTIPASPLLMHLGASSKTFPLRRSHFSLISTNLQAMWAVWQSRTGAYPFLISPGWFKMMTYKRFKHETSQNTFDNNKLNAPIIINSLNIFCMNFVYLRKEVLGSLGWIVLAVSTDISTTNFLHRHVLNVETNIVSWESFWERLVVHFHRFDLSGDVGGSKGDNHSWFNDTSFHSADWHSSNTFQFG